MKSGFFFLGRRRVIGGGGTPVVIDVQPATYETSGAGLVSSVISFNTDGSITVFAGTGSPYTWMSAEGVVSDYSIRATINSGTMTSGIAGVWQALSSVRTFGNDVNSVAATATGNITLEIRRNSDSVVLDSAVAVFTATSSGPSGGGGGGGGGGSGPGGGPPIEQ